MDWEKLKKSRTTLLSWLEDFVTCEEKLSPSSVRPKRNAKDRVKEYLTSIGKPDLLLSEVDKDFCRGFVAFLRTCMIDKHITYHCSRHTAATLAISAGAELYSVSKILGHRNLVSTQVYAKVNLEKKMEAVNLTRGLFGSSRSNLVFGTFP